MTTSPVLRLVEITPENRAVIEALAVTPEQTDYVSDVAASLVEATQEPDARPWYRGVYFGDTPVGFVMISDGITVENPSYLGPYYLWRLLIDRHHQGRGYGGEVLRLVAEYLRTKPDARVLLTSVVEGPASPLSFYLSHGFRATGAVHEGEPVLELDLRSPAGD